MKSVRLLILLLPAFSLCCKDGQDTTPLNDIIQIQVENYRQKADSGLIVANGTTRLKIIASIPAEAEEANRTIKFTTSEGSFDTSGEDKKSATAVATPAPSGGSKLQATAWLTLSTTSGAYTVSASINAMPAYKADTSFQVAPLATANILTLNTDLREGLRADGTSLVTISGQLSNTTEKTVTISTTEGTLLNSASPKSISMETDATGKYEARLQVDTEVKAYIISAKAGNSNRTVTRAFSPARAYPDKLLIEPPSLLADTSANAAPLVITIFLQRETGKVSIGTGVTVKSWQTNDQGQQEEKGRFTGAGNLSDRDGKLTISYHADTGGFLKGKPVTLQISSKNDSGATISSTINLRIK